MNDTLTITTLRCARCNKRFQLMNMDAKTEFKCPHCKCRHIKLDGQWYDERVKLFRK